MTRRYAVAAVAGRGIATTTPSLNGLAAAGDRGYNGGTMFSISKFLGHDEKFYDLLEASAQQADSSVHHLVALLTLCRLKLRNAFVISTIAISVCGRSGSVAMGCNR